MRRWVAVVGVLVGLASCGGGRPSRARVSFGGQTFSTALPKASRTVTVDELPADLANLWQPNVKPGDVIEVVDTLGGPVYLIAARRFAFGSCRATDALPKDVLVQSVCNP